MTRRLLLAIAFLATVAAALHGTTAAFTSATSSTNFTVGTGSVGIARDGDGLVLSSAPLAPGGNAHGTVRITNSGTLAAELVLARENVASTAPGGCAVRDALRLRLVEHAGDAERTLADGPLTEVAESLALGRFAAGESRSYDFTVTFAAAHGATATDNDNCFQGSVDTERFSWQAAESAS